MEEMAHQAGNYNSNLLFKKQFFYVFILSSLQGSRIQARKDEHGPLLLQKVASHYASKGEKSYNFNQFNSK